MSPPDANIEKQKRRHWPVFWGIVGAMVLAFAIWFVLDGMRNEAVDPPIVEGDSATPTVSDSESAGSD